MFKKLAQLLAGFAADEESEDFAEYALILGAMGLVAVAVIYNYRAEKGQTVAEFAIVMPILVLLFFGMFCAAFYTSSPASLMRIYCPPWLGEGLRAASRSILKGP